MSKKAPPKKQILLKPFWDELYQHHATRDFIANDPISIPYRFINTDDPRDAEFISFLVAMFAYGQRGKIIETMGRVVAYFENSPVEILLNSDVKKWQKAFKQFYYRFNVQDDLLFILSALQQTYKKTGSLKSLWQSTATEKIYPLRLQAFQDKLMQSSIVSYPDTYGMQFLLAQPAKGSAAKRLNMFLRWMIRNDEIDLGLWQDDVDLSNLRMPLDTHVGRLAREHKITSRASNNWQTVEEITSYFKRLNALDPVRYDIAMMGLGTSG